jgi:predicted metal-dependent phosphoesterase TrpH
MAAERLVGRADLHIHSNTGDGLASVVEIVDYAEHRLGLDIIAITDHDEVRGALAAREYAARRGYRVQVVTGTEVTTRHGHLLCYGVERTYPYLGSLRATIEAVRADGGWVVVPHPMSWLTLSVSERNLRDLLARGGDYRPEAIETLNPSVSGRVAYRRVLDRNRDEWGVAEFGGSDAHALQLVGTAVTTFPGRTVDDLRRAFRERTTRAEGVFWTFAQHREIAAANLWRSMILIPTRKVVGALRRPSGMPTAGAEREPEARNSELGTRNSRP